jgi:hypothetical protein
MLNIADKLEIKGTIEIYGFERGKKKPLLHQTTENIIVANGPQFILESVAASILGVGTFTRTQNTVVRYIGVGIGGNRQTDATAGASPLSDTYPAGFGGTNAQTDDDTAVSILERPVQATATNWLKEVAAPAEFPTSSSVKWSAFFDVGDLNLAPYTMVPISEIGLYKSSADPTLPNGGAGTYPGPSGHLIAYDNFYPLSKTAFWSFMIYWTWSI